MSRNTAYLTNSIDIVANSIHLLDENNNGRNIFDLFIDASDVKIPIPKINPNDESTRYDYIESDVNNDNVAGLKGMIDYLDSNYKSIDEPSNRNYIYEDNSQVIIKKNKKTTKKYLYHDENILNVNKSIRKNIYNSFVNNDSFSLNKTIKKKNIYNNFQNNDTFNYQRKTIKQNTHNTFQNNDNFTMNKKTTHHNTFNTIQNNDNFTMNKKTTQHNIFNNFQQSETFNYQKKNINNEYTTKQIPNYVVIEQNFYVMKNKTIQGLIERISSLELQLSNLNIKSCHQNRY